MTTQPSYPIHPIYNKDNQSTAAQYQPLADSRILAQAPSTFRRPHADESFIDHMIGMVEWEMMREDEMEQARR